MECIPTLGASQLRVQDTLDHIFFFTGVFAKARPAISLSQQELSDGTIGAAIVLILTELRLLSDVEVVQVSLDDSTHNSSHLEGAGRIDNHICPRVAFTGENRSVHAQPSAQQ